MARLIGELEQTCSTWNSYSMNGTSGVLAEAAFNAAC
jgi:hypothetical protein